MKSSVSDIESYKQICISDSIFDIFKSNADYQYVLEHLSKEIGQLYFDMIEDKNTILKSLFNDSIGSPSIFTYDNIKVSPTTLRYVKTAIDIQKYFGCLLEKRVLEIGGGYGGQYCIFQKLFGCKHWDIVDLKEVCILIKKYASKLCFDNFTTIPFETLKQNKYDVIISNYAFGECNKNIQNEYLSKVISNSDSGYMTITFNDSSSLSLDEILLSIPKAIVLPENPLTHHYNKLVVWGIKI